jgi:hypothetical protein
MTRIVAITRIPRSRDVLDGATDDDERVGDDPYRPIIAWARFKGTWGSLRDDKAWNEFDRNVRAPA